MSSPNDSLLDAINSKRLLLKRTETIIKHPDGTVFKRLPGNHLELLQDRTTGYVVDTEPDNVPVKIIDHLYLGSQDCCDSQVLTDYGITYVLSVGIEPPVKFDGITYKFVRCLDLPESDLRCCLDECLFFIESTCSCNILVHCNAGVSRSPSIVIAYLILRKGFNYVDAFNIVKKARGCIRPNDGFVVQLRQLDR